MDELPPIPDKFPFTKKGQYDFSDLESSMKQFREKDRWNSLGMYAFVCWEWVDPLVKWIGERTVLEVMAGAGWLARALREKGVQVKATDNFTWADNRGWYLVTDVEKMDAVAAVVKYGQSSDILIISWPYMELDAFHTIAKWQEVQPGGLIVYIGEDEGGCTASQEFFEHFECIDSDEFTPIERSYFTWFGLHDRIMLGKFK